MYPARIQKLIDLFSKFPTVGPRTAARFIFYLLKLPKEDFETLVQTMEVVRQNIKPCQFCFDPFDSSKDNVSALCPICRNSSRQQNLLCIIEKETDLGSIERTKKYRGLYFILGGTVHKLKRGDAPRPRFEELAERIQNPQQFGLPTTSFKEVIVATNATPEGELTALTLERNIKALKLSDGRQLPKITRLGRGLPVGGELEYADEETLLSAFEGRK